MRVVRLSGAAPGMVLAAPVSDFHGNPLFDAGTELSAGILRVLKAWGVEEVRVEAAPGSAGPAEDEPRPHIGGQPARGEPEGEDNPVMTAIMDAAGRLLNQRQNEPGDP